MQLANIGFGVATIILGTLVVSWAFGMKAKISGLLVVLLGVIEIVAGAYF